MISGTLIKTQEDWHCPQDVVFDDGARKSLTPHDVLKALCWGNSQADRLRTPIEHLLRGGIRELALLVRHPKA